MDDVTSTLAGVACNATEAITIAYSTHYHPLVRVAVLLLHDVDAAENVVQDAFVAMHREWRRLRDLDQALAYLRRSVLNRARSTVRGQKVVDPHQLQPMPTGPSAQSGITSPHAALMDALRRLPGRQREAVVLRYYADLSEVEIAETMRVSRETVKTHIAHGMTALRHTLERT